MFCIKMPIQASVILVVIQVLIFILYHLILKDFISHKVQSIVNDYTRYEKDYFLKNLK